MSRARVVNPDAPKSTVWTWTRGGWRDRYPNDVAQARRRQVRSYCDRIWVDLCADCRCGDWRHAGVGRRVQRHVDPNPTEYPERRLGALATACAVDDELYLLPRRQTGAGSQAVEREEAIQLEITVGHAPGQRLRRVAGADRHHMDYPRPDRR